MTESAFPWIGGGPITAGAWRGRSGTLGDGTMGDFTGTAFNPTVTGADKVVTVAAGRANIQNASYSSDAAVNHNIGAVGSAPTSGQYRWDLIVLRYDPGQALANRVKQAIVPGTPSTAPAFPAIVQDEDGIWEYPLISVKRGPGNINLTSAMVAKVAPWTAPTVYVGAAGDLPSGLPDAGIAFTGDGIYHRTPDGYTSLFDPTWTALTYASGIGQLGPALQWRKQAGQIHACGTFRNSGSGFPANAWTAVANVPAAWYTLGLRTGTGGFPPILPITLTSDFPTGSMPPTVQADLTFVLNPSGGVMYVRPRDVSTGRQAYIDWWLGPIADPRLA